MGSISVLRCGPDGEAPNRAVHEPAEGNRGDGNHDKDGYRVASEYEPADVDVSVKRSRERGPMVDLREEELRREHDLRDSDRCYEKYQTGLLLQAAQHEHLPECADENADGHS